MPSIVIRTNQKGEMDYDDLKDTVQLNRQRPAIILANIGTTMTEARDDIPKSKPFLEAARSNPTISIAMLPLPASIFP
jgi:histidine decarboxylase